MTASGPRADDLPRLAFVYHPRSFGTMAIAEAAETICELVWVIDSSEPDVSSMSRLLRRVGGVVDVAGMSFEQAAAAIAQERPAGILALADERLLWTARVAALLKLPFLQPDVAARLTDKYVQREALQAAGLPVPGFWQVPDEADERGWQALASVATFPAVLKPRRGEGSRDIVRVRSFDELRVLVAETPAAEASAAGASDGEAPDGGAPAGEAPGDAPAGEAPAGEAPAGDAAPADGESPPARHERAHDLVLEEYLGDRPEAAGHHFADYVSVESVVSGGQISHLAITGRFPPADPFRETGFFIPCAFDEQQRAEIADVATAAVRAIGVGVGVLHTEVKLTPDGPRVIELNGRIGGGVPEMLADATGVRLMALAMRVALGESIVFETMPDCTQVGYLLYVQAPASMTTVTGIDGLDRLRAMPGVDEVTINRGPGRAVDWRSGNHGHVFSVRGAVADHDELRSIERFVSGEVEIHGD
jgi:biotin carboxylase